MSAPRPFGTLPSGEPVESHLLAGPSGASAEILTLGGIVRSLRVPDRHGALANVVLNHDTLDDYLEDDRYTGAIAGRVAGRIRGARFSLDGTTYHLAANDPPNHLHGGHRGFDKHLWSAEPIAHADGSNSLRLARLSPHGEEGYPGNVSVEVTYTLTVENALVIATTATTDQATPFSLTHHSYFNLAGAGSAAEHTLQILAETYAPADDHMGLLGRREPVTPENDFRAPRRLAEAVPQIFRRHGDLYFLSPATDPLPVVARLADPASGRLLTVRTTEDCLQLYVGAALRPDHSGVCLECEGYPDGPNSPALGDIILRPGHPRQHTTVYAFSNLEISVPNPR